MKEEMLKVVPVTKSAKNTPDVDSSADARMAVGAAKVRNSNSSTRNTRTTASASTTRRSRNDFLLLLVGAAVNHANRAGNVQIGHGLLHQFDALAQAHAFKAARYGDTPLQVLADNFGLAAFILKTRERAEGRRSCRSNCW